MSVLSRWTGELAARRKVAAAAKGEHTRAQRALDQARAAGIHPRAKLVSRRDKASLNLRVSRRKVEQAQRVVDRHEQVDSVSPRGLALVASFEGFRANVYRDAVGVATQGYGETQGITPGKPWSQEYALARLRTRIDRDYLAPVLRLARSIGLELTANQADALASLTYNLGPGILSVGRSMGDALRSKNHRRIADAFLPYDKAGGRTLPGLTRRRRAERALYLS